MLFGRVTASWPCVGDPGEVAACGVRNGLIVLPASLASLDILHTGVYSIVFCTCWSSQSQCQRFYFFSRRSKGPHGRRQPLVQGHGVSSGKLCAPCESRRLVQTHCCPNLGVLDERWRRVSCTLTRTLSALLRILLGRSQYVGTTVLNKPSTRASACFTQMKCSNHVRLSHPLLIQPNQYPQPILSIMQRRISLKKSPSNSRNSTFKVGPGPLAGIPPGRCTSANADTTTILTYSPRSRTSSPASHPRPSASCPPSTALRNSSTRRAW
jgi:hypothetical protein